MPSGASATVAALAAHRRQREEAKKRHKHCVAMDESFVSQTATLEQKRDYASCVQTLYPEPLERGGGPLEMLLLGTLLGIVVLGILLAILTLRYMRRKPVSH